MKKLCVLLAVLTVTLGALAQAVTDVSGIVLSAEENEPVVGATVMVRGTNVGTMTDVDGKFRLKAPAGSKTLIVSFVGMHTQEVAIAPTVRVILENDAQSLDEVIVTGYGSTRRAAFTGAATVVDGDVIDRKLDVNFVKSLEGQVPGFQYNNSTSMPGQWGAVYVRGRGSLSSNTQPLYVIDGMPVNSDYDALSSTTNNFFDPMSAYNPSDIESVTVLKDAAATAIYGSRAANGVIVITTKKGAEGKFQINLDIKQGLTHIANNNMEYANADEMLELFTRGRMNMNGQSYDDAKAYLTNYFTNNYGWDGKSSYDWMDAVTRTGYYQDYNLSFSGTSGNTNYYVSLGYIDTEGIVIGSDNQRYSGRVGIDTKYKYFTAGVNASYSYSKNHTFSQSTGGSNSNPTVAASTSMLPFSPFYNEDHTDYWMAGVRWNPLAVRDPKAGDNYEITNETLNANPYLRVDLPLGIWAKTSFGANIMNH